MAAAHIGEPAPTSSTIRADTGDGNLADDACTPSHTRRLFEAIGHHDEEMHEIPGANHYYAGADQRDKPRHAVGVVTDWHGHGFSL